MAAAGDAATVRAMRGYLGGLALGVLAACGLLLLTLQVLAGQEMLPAPQFANSQCVDEKLRAMRLNPPGDANLLVVGSSVAFRHFSGAAAHAIAPGIRPYNAGFCHANIRQTGSATRWLVGRLPEVRHVLLIASPFDFEGCAAGPAAQFPLADVDAYVFGHRDRFAPYFRYFDPATLLRNAATIREVRTNPRLFDSVIVTPYGDGLSAPPWRGLHYDAARVEQSCVDDLAALAGWLERRGVRLEVTLTPVHPQWAARFAGRAPAAALEPRIKAALSATRAAYLAPPRQIGADSFYDAIHMHAAAADAYTRTLVRDMDALIGEIGRPS